MHSSVAIADGLSEIEILRIPLVGWMMHLARDIPLERGDTSSTATALEASRERLDSKVSVMIFPEGTRSESKEAPVGASS